HQPSTHRAALDSSCRPPLARGASVGPRTPAWQDAQRRCKPEFSCRQGPALLSFAVLQETTMARIDAARWAILSPVLDEFLETDAARGSERLAHIGHEDTALADELEALLVQHTAADEDAFLDDSAFAQLNEPGDVIGSYTLEREIGHGGMAFVWLA